MQNYNISSIEQPHIYKKDSRSFLIAHVSQPMNKRSVMEYLKSYFDEDA